MAPKQLTPGDRSRAGAVGQAVGIGFAVAAGMILPILLGVFLDSRTGRGPVFVLIGLVIGLAIAGYELMRLTKMSQAIPKAPDTVSPEERAKRQAEWDADHPESGADREDEE